MKKLFLLLFLFSVSLHATDTTKQTRSVPVIIKVLKYLNLDQTQKKEIREIIRKHRYKLPKNNVLASAITAKGFNKDAYISARKTQAEQIIEKRAKLIEDIVNTLTPEQVGQLDTLLNQTEEE